MTPDEYCQQKAAASGSSFYYSFLFLPPERRRAITAVYAYCREVDDVVDEVSDPAVAQAKLDWWRGEVDALFHGQPNHPVTRALAALHRRNVRHHAGDGWPPSSTAWRWTCGRTATSTSRRCGAMRIWSPAWSARCRRRSSATAMPPTLEYAGRLGLALQLINVIRDVGDDARRGRVYLPLDELQHFGVKAADLLNGRYVEGFVPMMQFQAERARARLPRSAGAAAGARTARPSAPD